MNLKLTYFIVLFLITNSILLAQSKNQLSIGNLVIYEIILSDTTSIKTTEKFHFLNDTSEIMANIIKDELHKCVSLIDDSFKIISPYTLEKTLKGEKSSFISLKECINADY
jgi:hypothetical protein